MKGLIESIAIFSLIINVLGHSYVDAHPSEHDESSVETDYYRYSLHEETDKKYVLPKSLPPSIYYNKAKIDDHDLTEKEPIEFQYRVGAAEIEQAIYLEETMKEKHLNNLIDLSESIYPGLFDDNVTTVQQALKFLGFYEGNIDGIYGPLTKEALELAENELDVTLIHETSLQAIKDESNVKQNNREQQEEKNSTHINVNGVIQVAESLIGTPYVWGGDSPGGFDCSGFIQYVFGMQGIDLPRTVKELWSFTQSVNTVSVGDLVFFETTKPGPSHMGIYIGSGKFIHAGSSRGVEISELNNSYWKQRYLGAKRIN